MRDSTSKESKNIYSGVPQGSVLGPILFLIYINDSPNIIPKGVNIKLFADDTKIYKSFQTKVEQKILDTALSEIEKWTKTWGIFIATNKTFVLHLGKNNPKTQYKINDQTINEVDSIRDLGVYIDYNLNFKEHISKIIKNAYFRMRILFKYIKSRKIIVWKTIFKAYIRPLLEYATEIWSPCFKGEISRIEKCQKYYTRIALIKCRLPNIPYEQRLQFFELPTLESRRKIFDLLMVFKIINGYTHLNPHDLFKSSKTRYKSFEKIISKRKSHFTSKSFINRSSLLWNNLDKTTKNSNNPKTFKQNLIKWLDKQSKTDFINY